MSHFYRYLQPLQYNFNRYAVEIAPKGGICFHVVDEGTELDHKIVTISAAICHDNDLFNKEVAKKIADNRYLHGTSFTLYTSSLASNMIALALVELSENVVHDEHTPCEIYRNMELENLARRIKQIRNTHRIAWELDKMSREVIDALDLRNYYAKHQNR